MKKVSVIVPVYKIPEYALKACIESLQKQTYTNIEILLVDDGSPDNCGSICDLYAAQDSRILSIHKNNGGVSSARNLGLEMSKGDYIMFVDADDAIHNSCISTMIKISEFEAADIVVCNYIRFFSEGLPFDKVSISQDDYLVFSTENELRSLQKKCLKEDDSLGARFNGSPWCKLYKADLIKQENYLFDTSLVRSQDNFFNLHIFGLAKKICYTPKQLYFYRYLEQSSVNRFRSNLFEISDCYLKKVIDELEKQKIVKIFDETYFNVKFEKLIEYYSLFIAHKENRTSISEKKRKMKDAYNIWIPEGKDSLSQICYSGFYSYLYLVCLKKEWFLLLYHLVKIKGLIRMLYFKYIHRK